jgi:predicted amidohydrolase
MLIISQERWHTNAPDQLEPVVRAGLTEVVLVPDALMLLLPLGEADWGALRPEADVIAELGSLAKKFEIYLAGAAPMIAEHSGQAQTMAFLIGPDGEQLSRSAKISPDFLDGFTDSACELGKPADLPVVDTPLGRVGMLINEDILFSHYARVLVYQGAEVILNPSREKLDYMYESRQRSRATRAYESSAYVAVSTPRQVEKAGLITNVPTASALYCFDEHNFERAEREESFLAPVLDINHLRRKRGTTFFNQPVFLRTALYDQGIKALAQQQKPDPLPTTRVEWIREARQRMADQARTNAQALPSEAMRQYDAILVQNEFRVIQKTTTDPAAIIQRNLSEAIGLAARNAANPNIKLVCFPEFFMTGSGGAGFRTPGTLERIAITYPGPELDQLSEFAMQNKVYVAGSSFEKDAKFPGRVFNSAFILNDSGDLIHRYRKIHCADIWGALPDTTPGSVFSQYLDTYGYDYLFPVTDTPLGRLATIVCFDHTVPETLRMLAQRGAEVIIHCTSDPHGAGRRAWEECRMTRAFDNSAYVLAPRPGGEYFDPEATHPGTFLRGYTRILGYDGRLFGEADTSGKVGFNVSIDLAALRRHRANPAANMLIWDDARTYAHIYEQGYGLPNDLWAGDPRDNPYIGFKQMLKVLERYYAEDIYRKPVEKPVDELADSETKMDSEFVSM